MVPSASAREQPIPRRVPTARAATPVRSTRQDSGTDASAALAIRHISVPPDGIFLCRSGAARPVRRANRRSGAAPTRARCDVVRALAEVVRGRRAKVRVKSLSLIPAKCPGPGKSAWHRYCIVHTRCSRYARLRSGQYAPCRWHIHCRYEWEDVWLPFFAREWRRPGGDCREMGYLRAKKPCPIGAYRLPHSSLSITRRRWRCNLSPLSSVRDQRPTAGSRGDGIVCMGRVL